MCVVHSGESGLTSMISSAPQAHSNSNNTKSGLRRKKKKIDSDIGEYIKFKEVPADPAAPSTPTGTEFVEEQQITDIEWEDIK